MVNTSNVNGPRKLAFSVENILDPTKFTGRKGSSNCGDSLSSNDRNNNPALYAAGNGAFGHGGDDDLSQAGE